MELDNSLSASDPTSSLSKFEESEEDFFRTTDHLHLPLHDPLVRVTI
jgi:hypothetical protein